MPYCDRVQCIICGSRQTYAFSKHFGRYRLTDVDYWTCERCGFTASKTHVDMSGTAWAQLNLDFHNDHFARDDNPYNRNQRYFNQALMISLLTRWGLVHGGEWLDWGSAEGRLSAQLERHFGLVLHNFDRYLAPALRAVEEAALTPGRFDLVVNTAVFEHVRSRETLNEIHALVSTNGCLAVHTLVCGGIPRDPDWMYLLPVHTAFHTNRSMELLMSQWGYTCSVYNEHSKLWVMFRGEASDVERRVNEFNEFLGWEYLHFSVGFMAYWP